MNPRFTLTVRSPSGLILSDIIRDAQPADFVVALTTALDTHRTLWTRLTVAMNGDVIVTLVCEDRGGVLVWRRES